MASKQVVLLTNRVSSSSLLQPDTLINYANDLDIASDGTIYFTDSVNISPHRCGVRVLPQHLSKPVWARQSCSTCPH